MKKNTLKSLLASTLVLGVASTTIVPVAYAQSASPKYEADVPASILTPDKVKTQLVGDLEFFDGMPSKATVEKSYDFLDSARGVEAFLAGIPAASVYAFLEGLKQAGLKPGDLGIAEDLLDARNLWLTANASTVYCLTELNLKDGPVVAEVPPGMLGTVDDAFFRFVVDIGPTGPDQGKGGKFLFVHSSYKGPIPEGYFVSKVSTYRNFFGMRAFVKDGDKAAAVRGVKEKFRMYKLAQAENPPEQKFVDFTGNKHNTVHANDFHFYEELNAVIQYEPSETFDPELLGLFASIGIKKGQPFAPDARMKKILIDAAAVGNAAARSSSFATRDKTAYFFPNRQWYSIFNTHDFMDNGAMDLDKRVRWHYLATGVTPAMATPPVGTGSTYPVTVRDSQGNYLDGGKTYKITLPAPVPVNNFWSFMVYSGQHRSMLETDQKSPGIDSNNPSLKANADGSYTVWFGPEAPKGQEGNWIQTMPGKSFWVMMRLYGPLKPWYDKTWMPGDLELVK